MRQRKDIRWKFYRFFGVEFHVYKMNTPIGKANELPIHLEKVQMSKHELNMKIMMITRVSGVAYHTTKPNQMTTEI
jgi:hypothetical protein